MIYSFTGHRPDKLGGYHWQITERLIMVAQHFIRLHRVDRANVGMALGWDQAVALACLYEAKPFVAYIPCDNQDRKWPEQSKLQYKWLLDQAYDVIQVTQGDFLPWKMQARNKRMIDESDATVALWNGDKHGGTYNAVSYALKKGKPVENLWANFQGCNP